MNLEALITGFGIGALVIIVIFLAFLLVKMLIAFVKGIISIFKLPGQIKMNNAVNTARLDYLRSSVLYIQDNLEAHREQDLNELKQTIKGLKPKTKRKK